MSTRLPLEKLALNVIESAASASALIGFQGPLSGDRGYSIHKPSRLWDFTAGAWRRCVWRAGGTWRSHSRSSGKADVRPFSTAWSTLCPHRLHSGTSGFWEKHIGPRARSHLEAVRAFSLVSELGHSRTRMFYQACSVNMLLTHWPSQAYHLLSDFHCLLPVPFAPPS